MWLICSVGVLVESNVIAGRSEDTETPRKCPPQSLWEVSAARTHAAAPSHVLVSAHLQFAQLHCLMSKGIKRSKLCNSTLFGLPSHLRQLQVSQLHRHVPKGTKHLQPHKDTATASHLRQLQVAQLHSHVPKGTKHRNHTKHTAVPRYLRQLQVAQLHRQVEAVVGVGGDLKRLPHQAAALKELGNRVVLLLGDVGKLLQGRGIEELRSTCRNAAMA